MLGVDQEVRRRPYISFAIREKRPTNGRTVWHLLPEALKREDLRRNTSRVNLPKGVIVFQMERGSKWHWFVGSFNREYPRGMTGAVLPGLHQRVAAGRQ